MFVITGGVIMNTLLAFAIFYTIALAQGKTRMETNTIGYISKASVADKFGLKSGDKLVSINGHNIQYWDEIRSNVFLESMGDNLDLKYERNGELKSVFISKNELKELSE